MLALVFAYRERQREREREKLGKALTNQGSRPATTEGKETEGKEILVGLLGGSESWF